jgi:hypothetical protein
VMTLANQLGITFDDATQLAEECAERGWLDHQWGTVRLRDGGSAAAFRALKQKGGPARSASRQKPRARRGR